MFSSKKSAVKTSSIVLNGKKTTESKVSSNNNVPRSKTFVSFPAAPSNSLTSHDNRHNNLASTELYIDNNEYDRYDDDDDDDYARDYPPCNGEANPQMHANPANTGQKYLTQGLNLQANSTKHQTSPVPHQYAQQNGLLDSVERVPASSLSIFGKLRAKISSRTTTTTTNSRHVDAVAAPSHMPSTYSVTAVAVPKSKSNMHLSFASLSSTDDAKRRVESRVAATNLPVSRQQNVGPLLAEPENDSFLHWEAGKVGQHHPAGEYLDSVGNPAVHSSFTTFTAIDDHHQQDVDIIDAENPTDESRTDQLFHAQFSPDHNVVGVRYAELPDSLTTSNASCRPKSFHDTVDGSRVSEQQYRVKAVPRNVANVDKQPTNVRLVKPLPKDKTVRHTLAMCSTEFEPQQFYAVECESIQTSANAANAAAAAGGIFQREAVESKLGRSLSEKLLKPVASGNVVPTNNEHENALNNNKKPLTVVTSSITINGAASGSNNTNYHNDRNGNAEKQLIVRSTSTRSYQHIGSRSLGVVPENFECSNHQQNDEQQFRPDPRRQPMIESELFSSPSSMLLQTPTSANGSGSGMFAADNAVYLTPEHAGVSSSMPFHTHNNNNNNNGNRLHHSLSLSHGNGSMYSAVAGGSGAKLVHDMGGSTGNVVQMRQRPKKVSYTASDSLFDPKRMSLPIDYISPGGLSQSQSMTSFYSTRKSRRASFALIGFGKLESYIKESKLGEGTYATVFKGKSRLTDAFVALKEIRLEHQEGAPCTAIREVSLLRDLKHANIVMLHDVIHSPKSLVLVFEYCDMDLKSYMEKAGGLISLNNVQLFMLQLLRGLDYCHKRRVLHRDLKPQNLLISVPKGELKLADFGLARSKTVPIKTYSSEVVTLWYRPPEVLLGSIEYSSGIDMWGCGCIFYEMATGRPLFPGNSVDEQLMLIFNTLGTPRPELLNAYHDNPRYKKLQLSTLHAEPLIKLVPRLPRDGLQLMSKLLEFDTVKRAEAGFAIREPYFGGLTEAVLRLKDLEPIFNVPTIRLERDPVVQTHRGCAVPAAGVAGGGHYQHHHHQHQAGGGGAVAYGGEKHQQNGNNNKTRRQSTIL